MLYDYSCQVCQVRLEGSAGPYAEAAHIGPLGTPYNGPDTDDNLLCLCPNHHVLFDYGGFAIDDDWSLLGIDGRLWLHKAHTVNLEHVHYHRAHYYRINLAHALPRKPDQVIPFDNSFLTTGTRQWYLAPGSSLGNNLVNSIKRCGKEPGNSPKLLLQPIVLYLRT